MAQTLTINSHRKDIKYQTVYDPREALEMLNYSRGKYQNELNAQGTPVILQLTTS